LADGVWSGGGFEGATSAAGPDGTASLRMTFRWADGSGGEPARSAAGADGAQIQAGVGTLRNFFQMILVDVSARDQIWDFDERMSIPGEARPTLTVGFLPGRTYGILILMGHKAGADAPPTLLASGYAMKTLEAGVNALEMPLVPIVVGAAFTHYANPQDVRQPGRLARTVGLDANAVYALVCTLGSATRYAGGRPGDALREVTGDGAAPLREADKAACHGRDDWMPPDGLHLVANYARYSFNPAGQASDVPDWYEKNGGHGTNGVATYTVEAGQASDVAGSVYFNMVYAPFGLKALNNWKDRGKFSHPVADVPLWIIRNGLNDAPQNADTNFGVYDGTASYNANGALSVGVAAAGGVAAQGAGLYEDNNPWPIDAGLAGAPTDLTAALAFLDGKGAQGAYGGYTVRLRVQPDRPTRITLGTAAAASDYYANIKRSGLLIEGTTPIRLKPVEALWAPNSNTVSYGANVRAAPAFPAVNPDPAKDLMVKFGVKAAGYKEYDVEDVADAFNAVSVYLKSLADPAVISNIDLGDYIDLPFLHVAAYGADSGANNTPDAKGLIDIAANSAINKNNGALLRLFVVGKNSFKAGGSYAGGGTGSTDAHVVFQFQNLPGGHRMNPTQTSANGYVASELRRYLADYDRSATGGAFLAGLLAAGVPDAVLWAPERAMAKESGSASASDVHIITDKVWLPTAWEMQGTQVNSNKAEGGTNQARLEYYDSVAKCIKYYTDADPAVSLWWAASPTTWAGAGGYFCIVNNNNGYVYASKANAVCGLAPAFCVR
jgi:hypothetical protein